MNINKSNPLLLHPLNKWMKKKKWSWFPHQIETFHHVRTGSDVVVFAPTGAGKTVLASEIVKKFYNKKKVIVLCHRLVLLEQLERVLQAEGAVSSFVSRFVRIS